MRKHKVFGEQKVADDAATVRNKQGNNIPGKTNTENFCAFNKNVVVNEVVNHSINNKTNPGRKKKTDHLIFKQFFEERISDYCRHQVTEMLFLCTKNALATNPAPVKTKTVDINSACVKAIPATWYLVFTRISSIKNLSVPFKIR